jgi:carbamate kinase
VRIVAALGGNALLQRNEPADAQVQLRNLAAAVGPLAALAKDHQLVLTHGNGPQVGMLALQSAADPALSVPYPLDTLGAETQGMIGYWLARELGSALPGREVATVLTQTVVDPGDPAFQRPTKFVGPVYSAADAQRLAAEHGWQVRPDGVHWRRVVASPQPLDIVELPVIRRLVDAGVLVIAAGGGGIPVCRDGRGGLHGVEAVVDKDLAAAVLAAALGADMLLLLTDVPVVYQDYGTPSAQPIRQVTPEGLKAMNFPAGSMGPKIEAAGRFVAETGGRAAIGALGAATELAAGTAGTSIVAHLGSA